MKQWLERQFKLSEFHSNVRTEPLAGLTTFVTMAYVLATVPNMMESAGLDKHVMFTVLILLVILTTCAMAFYTNRPFALAPGLGSVGIVTAMIANDGIAPDVAAGVIFWSGVLFIVISFLWPSRSCSKSNPRQPKACRKCRYRPVYRTAGRKKLWPDRRKRSEKKSRIRRSDRPYGDRRCHRIRNLAGPEDKKRARRYDSGNRPHYAGWHPIRRHKDAGEPVYHACKYRRPVFTC